MKDKINPDYYTKGKIQTADFIEDKKLDYFEVQSIVPYENCLGRNLAE